MTSEIGRVNLTASYNFGSAKYPDPSTGLPGPFPGLTVTSQSGRLSYAGSVLTVADGAESDMSLRWIANLDWQSSSASSWDITQEVSTPAFFTEYDFEPDPGGKVTEVLQNFSTEFPTTIDVPPLFVSVPSDLLVVTDTMSVSLLLASIAEILGSVVTLSGTVTFILYGTPRTSAVVYKPAGKAVPTTPKSTLNCERWIRLGF